MSVETDTKKNRSALNKIVNAYRAIAILLLNTLVVFVVANVLLAGMLAVRDRHLKADSPSSVFSKESLAAVYPQYTVKEREAMLAENWTRPYVYEDYVLFKERPIQGKYVNVSAAGFRSVTNQGPWPPETANLNVFVFGGSTMFGYGVADHETFASYFQEALSLHTPKRVCVYNFGVGFYYSTPERIQFERLLTQGRKADIAIFVDGLNDLWKNADEPGTGFRSRTQLAFDPGPLTLMLLQRIPMMQFFRPPQRNVGISGPADKEQIDTILQRYQTSLKLIQSGALALGITPVFVWQPVPCYKYDTKYHAFYQSPELYQNQATGYAEMERISQADTLGKSFLWCADLQQDEKECLYVDGHHYTATFARKFAQAVCQMCLERGIIKP